MANAIGRRVHVFLAHASGDKDQVRDVYHLLGLDGFNPWLDESSLVAGQDWQSEVAEAIAKADVIVVFLSARAVDNAGYLHKEIALALDVAQRQPEGSIVLIPLRLDDHEVPQRLQHLHWLDFATPSWYPSITKSFGLAGEPVHRAVHDLRHFSIGGRYLRLQRALVTRGSQLRLGYRRGEWDHESRSFQHQAQGQTLEYLVRGQRADGQRYYGKATLKLSGSRPEGGQAVEMKSTIATDTYAYTGVQRGPFLEFTGAHHVMYCATPESRLLVGVWDERGFEELIPAAESGGQLGEADQE